MLFCFFLDRKRISRMLPGFSSWAATLAEKGIQGMKLGAGDCCGMYVSDEFLSVHTELRCL